MVVSTGNGNSQQQADGSNNNDQNNNPFQGIPDTENILEEQNHAFSLMGKMMDGQLKFMEEQGNKMDEWTRRQEARHMEEMDRMSDRRDRRMEEMRARQHREMEAMRARHDERRRFGSDRGVPPPTSGRTTGLQQPQRGERAVAHGNGSGQQQADGGPDSNGNNNPYRGGNSNGQQQAGGGSNSNGNDSFPDAEHILEEQKNMFSFMGKMTDGLMNFMEKQSTKMDEMARRQEARMDREMEEMRVRQDRQMEEMRARQDREMEEMRARHHERRMF